MAATSTATKTSTSTSTTKTIKRPRATVQHEYLFNNGASSYPIIEYTLSANDSQERTYSLPVPSFIMDDTWPRVVAFYHPDQDASLAFQPTFIKLARKVRHDSQNIPVLFHAINCVIHFEVCSNPDFHIRVFPSLRVFTEGGVAGGQAFNALVEYDVLLLQVANVVGVSIDTKKRLGSPLGHSKKNGNEEWTNESQLITEGEENVTPEDNNGIMSRNENDETTLDIEGTRHKEDGQLRNGGGSPIHKTDDNKKRIYRDAQKSFYLLLERNIYLPDDKDTPLYLPPKEQDVLFDFLDLMHWSLPSSWIIHDMVNDLRNDFTSVTKGHRSLLSVLRRHDAVNDDWSDECRDSDSFNKVESVNFVGYSCGLWNLMHIISVGVSENHRLVMGNRKRVTPSYAAWVIRDFVDLFFIDPSEYLDLSGRNENSETRGRIPWCSNCKSNLLQSYDSCLYGLCSNEFETANSDSNARSHAWYTLAEWIWYSKKSVYVSTFDDAKSLQEGQIYNHIHRLYWPLGPQNPRIPVLKDFSRSGKRSRRRENMFDSPYIYLFLGLVLLLRTLQRCMALKASKMHPVNKLSKSV